MIDVSSRNLLRLAGYALLPVNDNRRSCRGALWRCKRRSYRDRFEYAAMVALEESGLLEFGPHHRWARTTEAGRKALEMKP